ncbi:hypothetical protein APHAL10511_003846 [Amanita phalloides]|nr:hypothetical protein APHAL10511_003846 [Amanita phalloides]
MPQQEQLLGRDVAMPAARRNLEDKKIAWVKEIQTRFDGHIVRRDKTSKRFDGQPINNLEPYDLHMIPVRLQDWELNVLANSMGDVMSKKRDGTLGDITSEKFYIYYRLNMVYPIGTSDEDRKTFPTFASKAEWDAKPGSKLAMLIEILQHLLAADEVDHATVDNQRVVFPPRLEQPEARKRKILVYYEYRSRRTLCDRRLR